VAREPAKRQRERSSGPSEKRPSPLRLWLRRQRGMLRPAALGMAAVAVIALLGVAVIAADPAARLHMAANAVSRSGFGFTVQELRVEGREYMPAEVFDTALGVSIGDQTLGFDPAAARARLEASAWVENAQVERHLPGTIIVRISERRAFAIWQHRERFAVIDRDGKVLETRNVMAFGALPLLVGTGADSAGAAMIDLLRTQPDIAARVQAAVRVAERRWNLRLHNGMDVMLPEGHEAAALQRLAELQARERLLDRPLQLVDMRLPDRLVLRPQPVAAPQPAPPQAPHPNPLGRSTRG
jgi:cell division protein FtsQ